MRGFVWQPRQMMNAFCEHGPERRLTCNCGFNAFKTQDLLLQSSYSKGRRIALGQVALSGEVIEYERGYRAQRARVVGPLLLKGKFAPELLEDFASNYGIKLVDQPPARNPVARWAGKDASHMHLHS